MDHGYVDQYAVAQRYLDHALSPKEREEFEAHLVDCQECTDRLLLAEMFHNRNGAPHPLPVPPEPPVPSRQPEAMHVRFASRFAPWHLFLMLTGAAALLGLLTAFLLLW